jgi:hypothetical protein
MAILAYEEDARNALLDSALERIRRQLEARISRDEFWDTLVAPKFNDPDFQSRIRGIFRGIVAQSVPCTIAGIEICLARPDCKVRTGAKALVLGYQIGVHSCSLTMVTIRPKRSGFVSQICSCNCKRSDFSSGKAVANHVPRNESRHRL